MLRTVLYSAQVTRDRNFTTLSIHLGSGSMLTTSKRRGFLLLFTSLYNNPWSVSISMFLFLFKFLCPILKLLRFCVKIKKLRPRDSLILPSVCFIRNNLQDQSYGGGQGFSMNYSTGGMYDNTQQQGGYDYSSAGFQSAAPPPPSS